MSAKATGWALQQTTRTPTDKLVLIALADASDAKTFECWPSISSIAEAAMCTPRTAINSIASLVADGFISKFERHASNGRQTSNLYVVHVDGQGCKNFTPHFTPEGETIASPSSKNHQKEPYSSQGKILSVCEYTRDGGDA